MASAGWLCEAFSFEPGRGDGSCEDDEEGESIVNAELADPNDRVDALSERAEGGRRPSASASLAARPDI